MSQPLLEGVGLGFRRELVQTLLDPSCIGPQFIEVAPENWMGIGGKLAQDFEQACERYPLTCHGLSLSLGSFEPLDQEFLQRLKRFFDRYNPLIYSEHLSYSKCQDAHLYDLLPIPFCQEAIDHIVQRIIQVQETLERKVAIENVSYYTPVDPEMDEATFIREIVNRSNCLMLLDINNVYVNSFNHNYDAKAFLEKMPLEKVAYVHMAGHEKKQEDLIIDTHGRAIIDPVYELFDFAIEKMGTRPTLLERDFNIPQYSELQKEMDRLHTILSKHTPKIYRQDHLVENQQANHYVY